MRYQVEPLHGTLVNSGRSCTFNFAGRAIQAFEGQSIAAALYAAGIRVFTRSFKYHRPRGLLCMTGDCPNCLMRVNGQPNVRTCIEPARSGQLVESQHAWPGVDFDLLRTIDRFGAFLPVGFYYKAFHKPRWLWPVFERVIRPLAGLGHIDIASLPETSAEVEHLHADVCVVGGGPAGLAAAETAARAGARVLLLDRQPKLGGHLLCRPKYRQALHGLTERLSDCGRVQVLTGTSVFGLYEGGLVGAFQRDRLLKIRGRQLVICTGTRERPLLFHNNDLPGIFLGEGALRLAVLHGVLPGRRAVVATDHDSGHQLAKELHALGIEIAAVIDARAGTLLQPGQLDWPVYAESIITSASGNKHVRAVTIRRSDTGQEFKLACNLVCMSSFPGPANELPLQRGLRYRRTNAGWQTDQSLPGLRVAGGAAGTWGLAAQVRDAQLQALEAVRKMGFSPHGDLSLTVLQPIHDDSSQACLPAPLTVDAAHADGNRVFVCLCEDVTSKDVRQAVAEGFEHVETLKRYSTVCMGPCQGKLCSLTSSELCASFTGQDFNKVGTTTSRPPAIPVELKVLAAAGHPPTRRTPMHYAHDRLGAIWLDAGAWKRPESYGDAWAEVRAVRNEVGLIDVSTLGKIEVIGPDAVEFLERVYVNSWANLKVGRARYGVMCTEEGILWDDGVGARLAPDRFYLTATTGNADAVFQWLELWRATWRLDVALHNRTSNLAAMNLAGPRAREVLSRETDLDLTHLPYLAVRDAKVAGVPCRVVRLGFVGEMSYEIHCPASLAWFLWERLLAAGADLGARPFGVEAQRIMRLEKGHIIIGQDTDALSNPIDAGLEGIVRFSKPAFIGKEPLLRMREKSGRPRLVGFQLDDDRFLNCPPAWLHDWEGCQVIVDSKPAGRVTSFRFSPTLHRAIGLAWVPAKNAEEPRFTIRWNSSDVSCRVTSLPFYDPQGTRLRS
jgi:sarcosine oxidase subunit alpha